MAFDTLVTLGMTNDFSRDAFPAGQVSFDPSTPTPRPVRYNGQSFQTYPIWGEAIISPIFSTFSGQATGRVLLGTGLYRVHYNPIIMALRFQFQNGAWERATGYASWDLARVRGFQYNIDSFSVSSDGRYIQIDLSNGRNLEE